MSKGMIQPHMTEGQSETPSCTKKNPPRSIDEGDYNEQYVFNMHDTTFH